MDQLERWWQEIKPNYTGVILLIRDGDVYRTFSGDLVNVRDVTGQDTIPYDGAERYIVQLQRNHYRVAVAERTA